SCLSHQREAGFRQGGISPCARPARTPRTATGMSSPARFPSGLRGTWCQPTSALPGATSRLPAPPTALGEEHKAVLRAAEPRERDTAGAVVGQLVPGALLEIAVGHRDDSRSRPISLSHRR